MVLVRASGNREGVSEVIRVEVSVAAQMGVQRNGRRGRIIEGEATDEDVEEEDVGFRNGEEEGACVARVAEMEEFLSEFGDGGNVETVAIENELSVGLSEVREGGSFVDERD